MQYIEIIIDLIGDNPRMFSVSSVARESLTRLGIKIMNAESLPIKPSAPLESPSSSRARRRASLGGPRNDTEISTQQNNLELVDLSGTRKDKFQLSGKHSDTQRETITTLQRLLRPKPPKQHQNEPIVKVDSITLPFPNIDRNHESNLHLQNWIEMVTKSHQIPIGSPAKVDKVKIESLMEEWPPEVANEIEKLVVGHIN